MQIWTRTGALYIVNHVDPNSVDLKNMMVGNGLFKDTTV